MVVALREKTGKERALCRQFFESFFFLIIFLSCELSSVQAIEIVSIARVVGDCLVSVFIYSSRSPLNIIWNQEPITFSSACLNY